LLLLVTGGGQPAQAEVAASSPRSTQVTLTAAADG